MDSTLQADSWQGLALFNECRTIHLVLLSKNRPSLLPSPRYLSYGGFAKVRPLSEVSQNVPECPTRKKIVLHGLLATSLALRSWAEVSANVRKCPRPQKIVRFDTLSMT